MDTRDLNGRTRKFAVAVLSFAARMPRTTASRVVEEQLVKAASSVGANYREAGRAESRRDFIHKVGVAAKECAEAQYWMEIVTEANIGDPENCAQLSQECSEILAILVAIGRNARHTPPPASR